MLERMAAEPCSRRRAMASAAALEGVTIRKSSTSRSSTDAAGVLCLAACARACGVSIWATLACVDGLPPAACPKYESVREHEGSHACQDTAQTVHRNGGRIHNHSFHVSICMQKCCTELQCVISVQNDEIPLLDIRGVLCIYKIERAHHCRYYMMRKRWS